MRTEFKPGAIFDFLTKGELDDSIHPLRKALDHIASRERPTDQDVQAAVTCSAGGTGVLDFGAPDASQVWDIRRIMITGEDTTTVVTCTVRLFKREVNPANVVDMGTQVPTVATYSRHQATYKPGENVLVRVTGFTASGRIFGLLQAEQTRWQALERYSI